jgi:hypothetical protein
VDPADAAGLIGRILLIAGALLTAAAVAAVLPQALRVRRRALALQARVVAARLETDEALAVLRARRAETDRLLAPWRTLLRWARHPLVVATLEWYRRRRRRPAGP